MVERALSGVRVLDLTQFEAGTSCTEFLGWLGAEIIKIEGPKGDQGRSARFWEPKGTDSIYFQVFNCNKRSIVIDLKQPEGRDLFLRMVPLGDVVIENFAPGLMEKLNLDYPVLKEINPRIIMARIKGFGLSGQYSDYKCFEMIAQAAGGAMSTNRYADDVPLRLGAKAGDASTGLHTDLSILSALYQREDTGRGQLVEASMQEVVANLMRVNYADHYAYGVCPPQSEGRPTKQVPGGIYPCAGGGPNDYAYILIMPAMEDAWQALARSLSREDWLSDPRFANFEGRWEHRQEINAAVTAWTSQRNKHEVMRILAGAGVPCSAVMDTSDILADPHLNERNMIITVEHPVRGPFRMPGSPFHLSDSPATTTPPPLLGQHTDEILVELFGMSGDEIGGLRERRVVA